MQDDFFSFEITGIKEADEAFDKLLKALGPEKLEKLVQSKAELVRNRARQNAPSGPTGNLKGAIYSKVLRRTGVEPPAAIVRISQRKAPHRHLVIMGTTDRSVKKKRVMYDKDAGVFYGRVVAPMEPNPFFAQTIEEMAWIRDEIRREVIAEVEKVF
jgi:hypothetical protein